MKPSIAITLAALTLAATPTWVHAAAQTLTDPTRPPAAFLSPATTGGTTAAAAAAAPRLQSILISPGAGGRQVAVIDGETVRLGERYKGARVARMSANEVELVRGTRREVLRLEPRPTVPGTRTRVGAQHDN